MKGSVKCEKMRELEAQLIDGGRSEELLMDEAGHGIAQAIQRYYPVPGTVVACIGSGNNGGDALVALAHLLAVGWDVAVHCLHGKGCLGELPARKWQKLGVCNLSEIAGGPSLDYLPASSVDRPLLLLDGLLGIGASGPLRSPLDAMASSMNALRQSHGADVVAMDLPSGMNGDTGETVRGAVIADLTLTVGVAKQGLLSPMAVSYTGVIETVPLRGITAQRDGSASLVDADLVRGLICRRGHDYHKGNAGRVGICAGSQGMLGAAVLSAKAAIRSGAGLVSVFAFDDIYPMLATMMPAEVMVRRISAWQQIDECRLDALVVGPGLGVNVLSQADLFFRWLESVDVPVVVDADAINAIALDRRYDLLKAGMVLTPHPGEMRRLFPEGEALPRPARVEQFVQQYPGVTLLLKGAHSVVSRSGSPLYVNGSGNAGMASGGQGDVLSGVIGGLLAQGVESLNASLLGSWLCGRAAGYALSHGGASHSSLIASDVIENLGLAFREIV